MAGNVRVDMLLKVVVFVDFVCDTSDTEWFGSDGDARVEYEPASEPDDDGPLTGDSSGHSDVSTALLWSILMCKIAKLI